MENRRTFNVKYEKMKRENKVSCIRKLFKKNFLHQEYRIIVCVKKHTHTYTRPATRWKIDTVAKLLRRIGFTLNRRKQGKRSYIWLTGWHQCTFRNVKRGRCPSPPSSEEANIRFDVADDSANLWYIDNAQCALCSSFSDGP